MLHTYIYRTTFAYTFEWALCDYLLIWFKGGKVRRSSPHENELEKKKKKN